MSRALRSLATIATLFLLVNVALGSVVCATDSSAACPNWPGCYADDVLPEARLNPVLEATHRLVAMLTTPLVLATAIVAQRSRVARWAKMLPWVALVGCLLAGAFGMMIILFTLPLPLAVADLGAALVALAAMVVLVASRARRAPSRGWRWALGSLSAVWLMHLSGIVTAGPGSYTRCMGWPWCQVADADPSVAMQVLRWGLAGVALVLLGLATWADCRVGSLRSSVVAAWAGVVVAIVLAAVVRRVGLRDGWESANSVAAVVAFAGLAWHVGRALALGLTSGSVDT